ncbi:DMT family transporter [Massilia sp. erpn]|uniref:DMT family transporter n=1 Tax=Massilia sp. erpn TaxID=2738142 RepID=UPI002103B9ED|nr:EamA family transporter [Massilia sp. erpn]UTY57785.1 EamA family transporter [Massilia sp. erpn]
MSSPVLFILASLIWGSTFFGITLQLGEVPPAVSVAYRFALSSAVLFAWCALRGQSLRLSLPAQRWTFLQGSSTFALSYICTYTSEQYLVSALVAVLYVLMVFWTPLLGRIAFGTPVSKRTWSTGAGALAGVSLLFHESIWAAWQEILRGGQGHFLLGLGLALTGTIASSVGNLLVVKVREHNSNVLLTMAWAMLWGTLLVAAWALISGASFRLPASPMYWGGLVYLALFGSVIAFACYFTLIHRLGAQKAVYVGVVIPVISVLLSIRMENFRPGPVQWLGMVVCLASVAWALHTPAAAAAKGVADTAADAEKLEKAS